MSEHQITIQTPAGPDDYEQVRGLLREYLDWIAGELNLDISYQKPDEELQNLPGPYAPPGGAILLAWVDGQPAGCVAYKPYDPGSCTMKRMYVRPDYRGLGVGRALVEELLELAREAGYQNMRLGTMDVMLSAQRLYQAMGFAAIDFKSEVQTELTRRTVTMERRARIKGGIASHL